MATQGCPCGYLGDPSGRCRCTVEQVSRYRMRLSGPLLDRIDMHIEVPRLPREALLAQGAQPCETSAQVRERVAAARARQLERCGRCNAQIGNRQVEKVCRLSSADQSLLEQAIERLTLSARAYHRILKVARTIADLDAADVIGTPHITEAISYRRLDRMVKA